MYDAYLWHFCSPVAVFKVIDYDVEQKGFTERNLRLSGFSRRYFVI